jgi:hypothetical protein
MGAKEGSCHLHYTAYSNVVVTSVLFEGVSKLAL